MSSTHRELFVLACCMVAVFAALVLAFNADAASDSNAIPESIITEPSIDTVSEQTAPETAPEPPAEVYAEPEPEYYSQPSGGLTMQSGVNYHNGRKECWYSSNVLYHYRTPEWWVDEEGFYRTQDGYYVVAASDMPEGTVFTGSKGECMVLDCGCAPGTTDYYVGW